MAGGCSPENEETVKKDTDINNVKKFTPTPTKVSDVIMKPTATPTPVLNNTPEIYFDEDKMEYFSNEELKNICDIISRVITMMPNMLIIICRT